MGGITTQAAILARHEASLQGRLRLVRLRSRALGLAKTLYAYEPPGYAGEAGLPLLYLFRGHEREWANVREDASRQATAVEDLDARIVAGTSPPLIALLPGLTSSDNHVPGLGIEMVAPALNPKPGLGSGRFWSYLTDEVIPWAETRYRPSQRLAAGFSLGGYTVSLVAFGKPGYLDHAGFYDALFPWPEHDDPRRPEHEPLSDRVWTAAPILSPAFGWPRDPAALARWNTTDWLLAADGAPLDALRRTRYWVQCAGLDGARGNRDRAFEVCKLLAERGCRLGFGDVMLSATAEHSWRWCDLFLGRFLDGVFAHEEAPVASVATGAS